MKGTRGTSKQANSYARNSIAPMSLLSGTDLTLISSVFIASAVESVEAVTIVLAAGTARHMRSAIQGALAALLALGLLVAVFGQTLTRIPESVLRFTIGILLLFFGLQWLRKATLRYAGVLALHDEAKIFQEEVEIASRATSRSLVAVKDWFSFTMSFKGVFLEGVEVAFIVISFASLRIEKNPEALTQASLAAIGAALVAAASGLVIHKPLTKVPENLLKYIVAVMLITFGVFWTLEGIASPWPTSEVDLLIIACIVVVASITMIKIVKRVKPVRVKQEYFKSNRNYAGKFFYFWYDFIIGDDWRMPAIVAAGVGFGYFIGYELIFITVSLLFAYAVGALRPK